MTAATISSPEAAWGRRVDRPVSTWPWIAAAGGLLAVGGALALASPLLGVVCLALPAVPLLVLSPALSLTGFIGLLPFDAVASLVSTHTLSLTRVLGLGVLGGWVLHVVVRRQPLRLGGPGMLLLAYACFAGISILWADDTSVTLQGLQTLAQLFLLYLMAANVLDRWGRLACALDVLLVATAVLAVLTLAQMHGGAKERAVLAYGDDVLRPNALAAALAVPALAAFARRTRGGAPGGWRLLALAPIVPALIATGSRGGMLAFATGLGVVGLCRPRLGIWAGGIALVGALALPLVLPATTLELVKNRWAETGEDRLSGRVDIWRVALAMIADRPLEGTGFFGFREAFYGYMLETDVDPHFALVHSRGNRAAHNIYLSTLAELGLAGAALLVAALGAHLRLLRQLRAAAQRVRHVLADDVAVALMAMLAALLVAGSSSELLLEKEPWLLLGAMQGAAFAAGWASPRGAEA